MTTRSIIDIDIRTQAWDEFQAAFNKFRKSVDEVPDAMSKIDKAVKAAGNPFKQINAVLQGTTTQIRQAATAQEKLRISAVGASKVFGVMAKSAGSLFKTIQGVTREFVKWGGLLALMGGGSLFGLDRLASPAGNSRRESQGLGVSPGELQAARINYQKLVDVDSMLAKINEAKSDYSKRYAFSAVGMNPADWENKNATQILKDLIPLLKKREAQGDHSSAYAHATGLDVFTDMETLRRLTVVTNEEIDATRRSTEADERALAISDKTQRAWQDFQIQLTRAGSQIELSFIRGLTGLTGPLSKLSAAVAHAIEVFLSSPKIGEWIDKVGAALEGFAKYLTSDDFEHDVSSFLEAVDQFAGSLWGVAKMIGKVFNFGNEQGLKASQYRKLEELEKVDPKLAKELEWALKNPEAAKKADIDLLTGKNGSGNLSRYMGEATPEARALAQALQDNTTETRGLKELTALNNKIMSDDFNNYGKVKLDKINIRPTLANGGKFADLEQQYGLPPGLLSSVEKQESGGNVNARSAAGAEGAFQFMPAAWKQYGGGGDIHNEADAAKAAAKYYRDLLEKFHGDLPKALAGYNWGAGNVDKYGLDRAPEETRNYIAKIIADMQRKQGTPGTDGASGSTAATGTAAPRQPTQTSQPVAVNIYKSPGADVWTTVNSMGVS